jgi:hypothetical protein
VLARVHAHRNGEILCGAAACSAMWRAVPLVRPVGLLARNRLILAMLERAYRLFLPARPRLQRLAICLGRALDRHPIRFQWARRASGPICEATSAHFASKPKGCVLADTRAAIRTRETSHPPSYYVSGQYSESALRRRLSAPSSSDIACG